jgi:hypothetical protein
MSSLFNRGKPKPFNHGSASVSPLAPIVVPPKPFLAVRAKTILESDDEDDNSDEEKDDGGLNTKRLKVSAGDGAETHTSVFNAEVEAKLKALKDSTRAEPEAEVDIKIAPLSQEDVEYAANLNELKRKLEATKRASSTSKVADSKIVADNVFDLETGVTYSKRRMTSRVNRNVNKFVSSIIEEPVISLNHMQSLAGVVPDPVVAATVASSSSSAAAAAPISSIPLKKMRTRLNGSHELKWKIDFNEKFGKVSCFG